LPNGDAKLELLALLEEKRRRYEGQKFYRMFPEEGQYRRTAYPKHMEFFALGAQKQFRMFVGPNGVGKSESCGGYETVCHLTGEYPEWWTGYRYDGAISAWASADTNNTLRESLQVKLIGKDGEVGTGIIPRDRIEDIKYKSPSGTLDYVKVKHVSGKSSRLVAKSYEGGRISFQAADVDFIWLDEEPPAEIYTECVQRFRGHTRGGRIVITETPLKGVSEVFCMFVPEFDQGADPEAYAASSRAYVLCTWDDIAHITPEERAIKIANCLPHELEARTTGMPGAGGGKIFPFAESSYVVPPLTNGIPPWWPRCFGLDVGWTHPTAAVWLAHDVDNKTIYAYAEHKQSHALPAVHIAAIQARGRWIPGFCDPSIKKTDPLSGDNLWNAYRAPSSGLRLQLADNTVMGESGGLHALYTRFAESRIKVVETCTQLIRELRFYQTNERNQIIKLNDDLIDALRYANQHVHQATTKIVADENARRAPTMVENTFGIYG
jgi:phage terminase large subunit-like protein